MRFILAILLLLEFGFAKKIALVIGNSDYKYMEYLSSPKADAKAISDKLKSLGFSVMLRYDLDEANMMATIKQFQAKLSKDDIGFFYYSGHGGQVNHESFLIPTSVDTRDNDSVHYHAVKVEEILSRMSGVGTSLNLLILDACRNDTPTGSKGNGNKGLGQVVNKPTGSLILYSTGMGKTAKDSRLFNQVVLEKLGSSKYILNVVNDISKEVYNQSGYKQKPEVLSSLVPDVQLVKKSVYVAPVVVVEPKPIPKFKPERVVVPVEPVPIPAPKPLTTKGIVKIGNRMYQNQPFIRIYNWEGAKAYCKDLTLGGYSDWRLPNKQDLNKIKTKFYDAIPKGSTTQNIRKEFINNVPEYGWFWTSVISQRDSFYIWKVSYDGGVDSWEGKNYEGHALCVR